MSALQVCCHILIAPNVDALFAGPITSPPWSCGQSAPSLLLSKVTLFHWAAECLLLSQALAVIL